MLNLPKSTQVDKLVPKERFYTKESSKTKRFFINLIDKVIWANKISPTTLNISTQTYPELQIFEVRIKSVDNVINKVILLIDSKIPYPVLFLLHFEDKMKAILSIKQVTNEKTVILEQFETDWQDIEQLKLDLKGNSVDTIYENYLYQINSEFPLGGNFEDRIVKYKQIKSIKKEITKINHKMNTEPSLSKKQALARYRNTLEKKINEVDAQLSIPTRAFTPFW